MKLSIITTIYQAEKTLPRLLDSMMAVKSKDIQFFLLDNGSTDGSLEICKNYASRDSRFVIHHLDENIGYIRARNLGLEIVDCDYVGFSDSDDYLNPNGYDEAIESLYKREYDLLIGAWNIIYEARIIHHYPPFQIGPYDRNKIQEIILPQIFGFLPHRPMLEGFMWKQIFRKKIIDQNKIRFNEELKPYEDMLFNAKVISQCNKILISNNILYNYIVNPQSITAKIFQNYSLHNEYQRRLILFNEFKNIIPDQNCINALANNQIQSILIMIYNAARCYTISKIYKEMREVMNNEHIDFAVSNVSSNTPFSLSIGRRLLQFRCIKILSIIAKLRHFYLS